jgi:enoyl-CoA hydratase/carnithine racemase
VIRNRLENSVCSMVIDRPDKRNALTPEMLDAMLAAVRSPPAGARALLLRGEGPVFCGGFDLKMCLEKPGTLQALLRGLAALVIELKKSAVPVVCAAHGAAIAGGCALLGGCDIVVTNDDAKLGYPVTPLGISPAVSAPFLRLLVGDGASRERQLDPALIGGKHAMAIGLAHESLAKAEAVIPRAEQIASELASKPPGALTATRAWLREIEEATGPADAAAAGLGASLALVGSAEERERLTALFTRTPR